MRSVHSFLLGLVVVGCSFSLVCGTLRAGPEPCKVDAGDTEVAEALLVWTDPRDLMDAGLSEGDPVTLWENRGCLADFDTPVGNPVFGIVDGAPAVVFDGASALQGPLATIGLVGTNPTRSIEAWVFNAAIANEETILAWGRRGGGCGTNMSFNYGLSPEFGAVGQWCPNEDAGWGTVPAAGQWHHLVYTYDGLDLRLYVDSILSNSKTIGTLATHADTRVTLAGQLQLAGDGITVVVTGGLRGSLALGPVRIHDGVLTPEQIRANMLSEIDTWPATIPGFEAPEILNAPEVSQSIQADVFTFRYPLLVSGVPSPTVEIDSPAGAFVAPIPGEVDRFMITYEIFGDPSFEVSVRAFNEVGETEASWQVVFADDCDAVGPEGIEVAGRLLVDLDAENAVDGALYWPNNGCLGDFYKIGNPVVETVEDAVAVTFDGVGDIFQCVDDAPSSVTGLDPTRSIEAWVFNPVAANEETIVSWGMRGGPCGTNMSFNYGVNPDFGAIGQWCDATDIGWGILPAAAQWHHLAYTYDGETTRVYSDGALVNEELVGFGMINTHVGTKFTVAGQLDGNGVSITAALRGSLSIAILRIHEEVLSDAQIEANFEAEKDRFSVPGPVEGEKLSALPVHRYSFEEDASDSIGEAHGTLYGPVTFLDGQAALGNDGTQNSNAVGQSPPADPPGAYIDLPNGMISALGQLASFEVWTTWNGPAGSAWQRIFDFGTSDNGEDFSSGAGNSEYLFLTPRSGPNSLRFATRSAVAGNERAVDGTTLALGVERHIVVTWDGVARVLTLYVDGIKTATNDDLHVDLEAVPDVNNWLGRSQWPDAMFNGSFNEFRIYNYVLSHGMVVGNFDAGPQELNIDIVEPTGVPFVRGDANNDTTANISDAQYILNFLFLGGPGFACFIAADANDDGAANISDAQYVLNFLFLGGPPIPPPAACGQEPLADEEECADSACP